MTEIRCRVLDDILGNEGINPYSIEQELNEVGGRLLPTWIDPFTCRLLLATDASPCGKHFGHGEEERQWRLRRRYW